MKINKSINLIYQKLIKRKPCESIRWEYLMWKNLVGSEPFAGVHCQHCMDQLLRCQERFTHFHSDKTKNQLICFELKVNLCKRGNRLPVAFISAVLACICIFVFYVFALTSVFVFIFVFIISALLTFPDPPENVFRRVLWPRGKRSLASKHGEEKDTQAPDVAGCVVPLLLQHLRRHIVCWEIAISSHLIKTWHGNLLPV